MQGFRLTQVSFSLGPLSLVNLAMRGKGDGKFVLLRPCTDLDYLFLVAYV